MSKWLKAAAVRAAKTAAQAGLAMAGTGLVGILDLSWARFGSVVALAAFLSLLTSVGGLPEVDQ